MDNNKILKRAGSLKVEGNKSKLHAWQDLEKRIDSAPKYQSYKKLVWATTSVAAAAIVVFILFIVRPTTYQTLAGEKTTITLPDNSLIYLNAGTTLKVNTWNWDTNRGISLDGEAFFVVTPGSSFSVESVNGTVKVLGTEFNVYSRQNHYTVDCYSGKVNVTHPRHDQSVDLIANEGVRLNKDDQFTAKYTLNSEHAKSWFAGQFFYESAPLQLVFDEIERQFGYTVKTETDISSRYYSGHFTDENLITALELVCVPMGIHFSIVKEEDEKVIRIH